MNPDGVSNAESTLPQRQGLKLTFTVTNRCGTQTIHQQVQLQLPEMQKTTTMKDTRKAQTQLLLLLLRRYSIQLTK